jgi:hypothetical protein
VEKVEEVVLGEAGGRDLKMPDAAAVVPFGSAF